MLYLNDELYKLSLEEKARVHKELGLSKKDIEIGKWFITIKMPEYFYSKSQGNDKPDRPAVAVIPLNCQKHENGSQTWNYCTGRNKRGDKWEYFWNDQGRKATILEYVVSKTIPSTMIDLIYFLLFLSPMREIPNETEESKKLRGVKPTQRFQFVVENKEKEAAIKINARQLKIKVESAIMGDNELPIAKIRVVASAFHVSNAETKGELEIRAELMDVVEMLERTGKKGYEQFSVISKLDNATDIKASIQKAIDLDLIKEDAKGKVFCYMNNGVKRETITGSIGSRTLRESLEFHLEQNPNALDELKSAIEEKQLIEA